MFLRLLFLDRLQQEIHVKEERIQVDETNRADLLALHAVLRRLAPKRRWLLANEFNASAKSGQTANENSRTYLLTSRYSLHSLWQYPATSIEKPPTGRLHVAQSESLRVGWSTEKFHTAQLETRGLYVYKEW